MRYRIVCTEQEPVWNDPHHAHIVAVGVGTEPSAANARWTVGEVLAAMKRGDTFYTKGIYSGRVAEVHPYQCQRCSRPSIRSAADAVSDNNLDNLRTCSWKAA